MNDTEKNSGKRFMIKWFKTEKGKSAVCNKQNKKSVFTNADANNIMEKRSLCVK